MQYHNIIAAAAYAILIIVDEGKRYLIICNKLEEYFLNGGCFDYPEEELDEPEGWDE